MSANIYVSRGCGVGGGGVHVEGEGQGLQGVSRGRVGQVYEGWADQ